MARTEVLRVGLERVELVPVGRVTDDTRILSLKELVFEPLLRWQDGRVEPALFGGWTHSADGRNWRFEIRPGARWHDGRACRAEDIVEFIDAVLAGTDMFGMKWAYARYLEGCTIRVASENTVALLAQRAFADVLDVFAEFHPVRADSVGLPTIGTGPYRVIEYRERERAVLQAVMAAGDPARIELHCIAAADERYRALRDTDIDAALNLERCEQPIRHETGVRWVRRPNTLSVMAYFDCAKGLFASPAARLAVNLAVDVRRIIDQVLHGLGTPAATIVSPHHLGFRSAGVAPIAHDPEKARRLLDTVAISGELVLRTPATMPERAPEIMDMVKEDLAHVGLAARIDLQPDRPAYAREIGAKQMGDIALFDSSPASSFRVLSDKISSEVKGTWWQGYHDDEVERGIAEANAAIGESERAAAYGNCLRRLNENPPWLYLFHPIHLLAASPAFPMLDLDHRGILRLRT